MSRLVEIKGYDGDYFISDCGDVFSFKSGKSKILKKRINQGGYHYVNLCKNGKYKSFCIHRLVGIYFVDKYDENLNVLNHIDGNKLNNNYDNLEWCTLSYNTKEAIRLGLFKIRKGEESNLYSGKINNDVAKTIRDMRNNRNMSYGEIADIFDLSRATIINICKNRIYT